MLQVTHFFGGFLVEFPKQYTLELSNVSLFLLCGARSKEYALLRNVSKLHPEVPKLLPNVPQLFRN